MYKLDELMKTAIQRGASDLHMTVGTPPTLRINGKLIRIGEEKLRPDDTKAFSQQLVNERQWKVLVDEGHVDFSLSIAGFHRFRINIYRQRNSIGIAMRSVLSTIPNYEQLGLPPIVKSLTQLTRGLILVTGPTGSGKSTTLACMIDQINNARDNHIITLEEPIEYFHTHQQSIVNQREVGTDCTSFAGGLRAALRQDPDVILIGEMRDHETISTALTAAETGHLVLSTLHTIGAAKTIDRIVDVFPPHQQHQIRTQLSMTLKSVISQQLIVSNDQKKRVAAIEVMISNPAVSNLIREGKTHQIESIIQTGRNQGMITMDAALCDLYSQNLISRENALIYSVNRDYVEKMLKA